MSKSVLLILVWGLFFSACPVVQQWEFMSPDGNLEVKINSGKAIGGQVNKEKLSLSVWAGGVELIPEVKLGLVLNDGDTLGHDLALVNEELTQVNESWQRVWGRRKKVRDHYNQLKLTFKEKAGAAREMDVYVRIYNDGLAFRYGLPKREEGDTLTIIGEATSFSFEDNFEAWPSKIKPTQESEFLKKTIGEVGKSNLPLLVNVNDGHWVGIMEANVTNWAGMYLEEDSVNKHTVAVKLASVKETPAVTFSSNRAVLSPWRAIMVAKTPGAFLESDLIHNLNEPNALLDVSWIKPGKSAWDWWWCNNYAPDVDFELGPNTETMKYFIDFASEMGWEYQLVDWQWYGEPFAPKDGNRWRHNPEADITTCNPDINIKKLVSYAKSKNVKLLIWLEWHHVKNQMEEAFALYEQWGVSGIKIDFMNSQSQDMVNFYHKVIKLAAKHRLLVDFHGAYKPTGISRTYPNLITREGVLGNEYSKWSNRVTPEHTVSLAFTRNIFGEMDFTPGGFSNVSRDSFKTERKVPSPVVMGTRCNQLAMMVVFESALQVLCDAPYVYRNSPAGLDFLKAVPTTWDDTKVIKEQIGDYIGVARRSGRSWYVGCMTDWEERDMIIKMDFLEGGSYRATIWRDAPDANEYPQKLVKEEILVDNATVIGAKLAKGGGCVIIIEPV